MRFVRNTLTVVLFSSISFAALASTDYSDEPILSPWMTGPLLAPSGHTIPAGHTNYEPYLFINDDFGTYNSQWVVHSHSDVLSVSPTMIISQGLSDLFDLQASIPYHFNSRENQSDNRMGDVGIILGYQAVNARQEDSWPNVRLTLAETFPVGQYQNLNPFKLGTDATGVGSYQTSVGANLQKVFKFRTGKFLRARFNATFTVPAKVRVHGFNAFGGSVGTNGTVDPGDKFSTDLGFEYTLTQHWVPALDITYSYSKMDTFTGIAGVAATGLPAVNVRKSNDLITLAPAIEYNWTAKLGLIVGAWFSVAGKNSADFAAAVFALNYYN